MSAIAEMTVNAINAVALTAEGHIEFSRIIDLSTGIDYREDDLPVGLPLGHIVRASVKFWNDTDYDQDFYDSLEFIDPDGYSRGKIEYTGEIAAGGSAFETTPRVTLDKPGVWQVHAVLDEP